MKVSRWVYNEAGQTSVLGHSLVCKCMLLTKKWRASAGHVKHAVGDDTKNNTSARHKGRTGIFLRPRLMLIHSFGLSVYSSVKSSHKTKTRTGIMIQGDRMLTIDRGLRKHSLLDSILPRRVHNSLLDLQSTGGELLLEQRSTGGVKFRSRCT